MGLLDTIRGAMSAAGGTGGASESGLMSEAVSLLQSPQTGGVSGLLEKFESAGLGQLAAGWVSNGPNPPATADHIQAALGSPQVAQIAAKLGITPQQAASGLAVILPHLVDHLTPNGTTPDASTMQSAIVALKGKLLGGA